VGIDYQSKVQVAWISESVKKNQSVQSEYPERDSLIKHPPDWLFFINLPQKSGL